MFALAGISGSVALLLGISEPMVCHNSNKELSAGLTEIIETMEMTKTT